MACTEGEIHLNAEISEHDVDSRKELNPQLKIFSNRELHSFRIKTDIIAFTVIFVSSGQ